MSRFHLSTLDELESESIYVLREAVAQCEKVALLFSGGKDSIVLSWLAKKAFAPGPTPFFLLHVDTGHNFPETLAYRDAWAERLGMRLVVKKVQDSIDSGRVVEESGPYASRNALQSVTLVDAIAELGLDACLGGGRRDEEKARAKERFFSHRDAFSQWDPKNQRPELWSLYNGRKAFGEHFRIFPLSNWTERDVWRYLKQEEIPLPALYFAHRRPVFVRQGQLLAASEFLPLLPGENLVEKSVRFRTIGDITCTGAVESEAATLDEVLAEVEASRTTERGTRADDRRSEAAMEDRKKAGYF
jgi:sulfate adenylyltransferase subunit 2